MVVWVNPYNLKTLFLCWGCVGGVCVGVCVCVCRMFQDGLQQEIQCKTADSNGLVYAETKSISPTHYLACHLETSLFNDNMEKDNSPLQIMYY